VRKEVLYYLFCIGIVLFHIFINLWWLKIDNALPVTDSANQFLNSIKYGKILESLSVTTIFEIPKVSMHWPPLVGILIGSFINALKLDIDGAVLVMDIVFLSILIFSVFKIGQIFASSKIGMLSAFLVSMYPGLVVLTRHYNLDLPLTGIIALAFYFLFKTERFTRRSYSILLGIVLGLGMLTKQVFLIFIIIPLLFILFPTKGPASFRLVVLTGILGLLIGSIWWLPFFLQFNEFRTYWSTVVPGCYSFCNISRYFSFHNLIFYFLSFINVQSSLIYFLFFLIGLVFFILRYKKVKYKFLLLLWIIWIYFIFTFLIGFICEGTRYTIPILIPVSLITSIGIMSIRWKLIRWLLLSFIIIYAFIQFAAYTIGIPFMPERIATRFRNEEIVFFAQAKPLFCLYHPRPNKSTQQTKEVDMILKKIRMDSNTDRRLNILILDNSLIFGADTIDYFAIVNDGGFNFEVQWFYFKLTDAVEAVRNKEFSYIIHTNQERYRCEWYLERVNAGLQWIKEHPEEYFPIFDSVFFDGTHVVIYRHIIS
jgi:4-amino-4-deoxy-L-arabinose transferase-like glycosyltransferase